MSTSPSSDQLGVAQPPAELIDRLRTRLVDQALTQGLLDVTYRTHDSPVGALLLAATEAGVLRVAFACEDHDKVLGTLAATVSPRIMRDPRRLDRVVQQLDEYFDRRRERFDVPVDLRLVNGFRRTALDHLGEIRYGATASYSQLAALAGNAAAVRAAASACSHNPVPLLLPCHRVVKSDGTVGNYLGGGDAKAWLLNLERAA